MASIPLDEQIRESLRNARDVRRAVHAITLRALTEARLERAEVQRVVELVVHGVRQGAAQGGDPGAVGEALKGLDEALAWAAKATQLALEDAAAQVRAYSREDLQRGLEDLKLLEEVFLAAVGRTAGGAGARVGDTLHQFAEHAKIQGTAVGRQVAEALPRLGEALGEATRARLETGVTVLGNVGALMAGAAAGLLSGLADRLQPGAGEDPGSGAP